jgi:hypothetical protein
MEFRSDRENITMEHLKSDLSEEKGCNWFLEKTNKNEYAPYWKTGVRKENHLRTPVFDYALPEFSQVGKILMG